MASRPPRRGRDAPPQPSGRAPRGASLRAIVARIAQERVVDESRPNGADEVQRSGNDQRPGGAVERTIEGEADVWLGLDGGGPAEEIRPDRGEAPGRESPRRID